MREGFARLRRQVRGLLQERDIQANRLHGAPAPCGIETLAPSVPPHLDVSLEQRRRVRPTARLPRSDIPVQEIIDPA